MSEQPAYSGGLNTAAKTAERFVAGSVKSKKRLAQLNFDPIEELVITYEKLRGELEYYEAWRDGAVEVLTTQGKPRAWPADVHMSVFDRLIAIGDKLLRYGYGRVPETQIVDDKRRTPMVINLTKKGQSVTINKPDEGEADDEQPE